jgi:hypothetical protein
MKAHTALSDWFKQALLATCFHTGFLLGLLFDSEDGGEMFVLKDVDFQRNIQRCVAKDLYEIYGAVSQKIYSFKPFIILYFSILLNCIVQ